MSQIKQITGELSYSLLRNINKNIDSISFEFAGRNELKIRFILLEKTKIEEELITDFLAEFDHLNELSKDYSCEAILLDKNTQPRYIILYKKYRKPTFQLGKKIKIKSIELDDDILADGYDDSTKIVTVTMPGDDGEQFKFRIKEIKENQVRFLDYRLSEEDYKKFIKSSKLKAFELRDTTHYKTKDRLTPYYHVVKSEKSEQHYLLCIGYGEYQSMRFMAVLQSIHEMKWVDDSLI